MTTKALSYSERYGGPSPSSQMLVATRTESAMPRGRLFVIVGILVAVLLVALVWQTLTFL